MMFAIIQPDVSYSRHNFTNSRTYDIFYQKKSFEYPSMDFEVILLEYLSVIKYKWREKLKYLHLYFLNLTEGEGAVALTIEVGTVAFTIFLNKTKKTFQSK